MWENGRSNQNPHLGHRATVEPILTITPWPRDATPPRRPPSLSSDRYRNRHCRQHDGARQVRPVAVTD
jgi:hypothetical protein